VRGLDILKLTKNPLIYTVYFHISVCGGLEPVVGLGLGGPEARLKGGPYDDVIIISQP